MLHSGAFRSRGWGAGGGRGLKKTGHDNLPSCLFQPHVQCHEDLQAITLPCVAVTYYHSASESPSWRARRSISGARVSMYDMTSKFAILAVYA